MIGYRRTGREPELKEEFIGLDVMLNKSIFSCDLEYLVYLQLTLSFNIDWSTFFVSIVISVWVNLDDQILLVEIVSLYYVSVTELSNGSQVSKGIILVIQTL